MSTLFKPRKTAQHPFHCQRPTKKSILRFERVVTLSRRRGQGQGQGQGRVQLLLLSFCCCGTDE